jgi:hypothetical protein
MSISSEITRISGNVSAALTAIGAKGVTIPQGANSDDLATLIAAIETGGGGDEPIPEDGKTRIWIHIADGTPDSRLTFYLRFTASMANNTTVDWGDGTTETLGSTTATNYSHKYPSDGDYVITMTVNSGTISFVGDSDNAIYGSSNYDKYHNRVKIKRIIFGDKVASIGDYACRYCSALTSVTIHDSITSIGKYAFNSCYFLAPITIPDNVTNIGDSAFNSCYSITSITIPDGVTSIGANVFQACYGMTSITIPDGVTSIGTFAFRYCYSMSEYHFKPTIPPTLANSNAFTNIPYDCIIYVPQGSLSAYQTATNWSIYTSHMQEEPQ